MSKAFLVFVVLVFSLPSVAAEEADPSSPNQEEPNWLADTACLDAITYLIAHSYERSSKPLSATALAYVRRCNGHPDKAVCEVTSQAMMRQYGKTPFTCGSDTADYTTMPVIVPEHPLLVMPDSAPSRK
jgi:hypothetical protein